jgi:DNA polymerase V
LLGWALRGLERIYRPGFKYKKAGVMLNRLTPADALSMRLFGDGRFEKSRRLIKALDEINGKYGRGTVRFGVARSNRRWETKIPAALAALHHVPQRGPPRGVIKPP